MWMAISMGQEWKPDFLRAVSRRKGLDAQLRLTVNSQEKDPPERGEDDLSICHFKCFSSAPRRNWRALELSRSLCIPLHWTHSTISHSSYSSALQTFILSWRLMGAWIGMCIHKREARLLMPSCLRNIRCSLSRAALDNCLSTETFALGS